MLENFSKIKTYNPYHDFVSYFVPLFLVFIFGYFSHYDAVGNTISLTLRFNVVIQIFLALVVFTAAGKVLYEITSYILSFFQVLLYKIAVFFGNRQGLFGKIGHALLSLIPKASSNAIAPTKLSEFLSKNPTLRSFYARIRMTSFSFQTGLGAVLIGFFVYTEDRLLFLGLFIVILFLALSARQHLISAEVAIEQYIAGK